MREIECADFTKDTDPESVKAGLHSLFLRGSAANGESGIGQERRIESNRVSSAVMHANSLICSHLKISFAPLQSIDCDIPCTHVSDERRVVPFLNNQRFIEQRNSRTLALNSAAGPHGFRFLG